jgi:glucosamine--fructose-6-phosphate aminotransferase (isomerizing)
MCGVIGLVVKQNFEFDSQFIGSILSKLYSYSELRGKEASGIAIKNRNKESIEILRNNLPGSEFVKSKEFITLLESINNSTVNKGFSILGHTRIATNGSVYKDNQPIQKLGAVGIHNGIICNVEDLWVKHKELKREQNIDTELLVGLLKSKIDIEKGINPISKINYSFDEIEGSATYALIFENYSNIIFGTNVGSLYLYNDQNLIAFASEEYILKKAIEKGFGYDFCGEISHITPGSIGVINEISLDLKLYDLENLSEKEESLLLEKADFKIKDVTTLIPEVPFKNTINDSQLRSLLEFNIDRIKKIRRCSKCVLPETHPFIVFDEAGICNFCHNQGKRDRPEYKDGRSVLEKEIEHIRKKEGNNCILLLSGGRDSCYALHVLKKVLGLNPIAYSYDWGMLTDLGRRNQARMCAKLGVEHIIVSANIKEKRKNINKNVNAWFHKPHLGSIGLFMAGDKAFHYYATLLSKRLNLPLFNGGSPLEYTYFKDGFSGVKPSFVRKSFYDKLTIVNFFIGQALLNPKYINSSILDNLSAFRHYYIEKMEFYQLFNYLPWDEETINKTLIEQYNWEIAKDTSTTWRIGDGTAAFYNYIYYTVAGFTENDCLRSNQINAGVLTREKALELIYEENRPRMESLRWYCDTIGVDLAEALKVINAIPKLY